MKATLIAVGSEMLTPFRLDTNSLVVTERLNAIGYDIRLKTVVGDDLDELAGVFRATIGSVDLIVCTGGLGPTEDDLTRDALARVIDVPLDLDEEILEGINSRFARRGLVMSGDQPAPGDGAARRDGPAQRERHRPGLVARNERHRHRAAARPAARDDADARRAHPRPPGRGTGAADCSGAR